METKNRWHNNENNLTFLIPICQNIYSTRTFISSYKIGYNKRQRNCITPIALFSLLPPHRPVINPIFPSLSPTVPYRRVILISFYLHITRIATGWFPMLCHVADGEFLLAVSSIASDFPLRKSTYIAHSALPKSLGAYVYVVSCARATILASTWSGSLVIVTTRARPSTITIWRSWTCIPFMSTALSNFHLVSSIIINI